MHSAKQWWQNGQLADSGLQGAYIAVRFLHKQLCALQLSGTRAQVAAERAHLEISRRVQQGCRLQRGRVTGGRGRLLRPRLRLPAFRPNALSGRPSNPPGQEPQGAAALVNSMLLCKLNPALLVPAHHPAPAPRREPRCHAAHAPQRPPAARPAAGICDKKGGSQCPIDTQLAAIQRAMCESPTCRLATASSQCSWISTPCIPAPHPATSVSRTKPPRAVEKAAAKQSDAAAMARDLRGARGLMVTTHRPQRIQQPRSAPGGSLKHPLQHPCSAKTPASICTRLRHLGSNRKPLHLHPLVPHQKRSSGSRSSSPGATTSRKSVWLSGSRFLPSTRCRCHTSTALQSQKRGGMVGCKAPLGACCCTVIA